MALVVVLIPAAGMAQTTPLSRAFAACMSASADSGMVPLVAATWLDVASDALSTGDADAAYTVSLLADLVPRADGRIGPLSLPRAYRNVLEHHEAPLPSRDRAALRRERRAIDVLVDYRPWYVAVFRGRGPGHPSAKLLAYRGYAADHRRLEEFIARADAPSDRRRYGAELAQLDRNWQLFGFKKEVDDAFELIDALHVSSPAYWQQIRRAFATAERSTAKGNRYYPTLARPGFSEWAGADGWSRCVSADNSQTFEFKIVQIQRPWFDRIALFSRTWRWAAGSPYSNALISDGTGGTTATPGWVPLVPESLVLVRNASIEFAEGIRLTTSSAPRLGGWLVSRGAKSPDPLPGVSWPSDGVAPPVRTTGWGVRPAAIAAVSWRTLRGPELRRYPITPNPAVLVQAPPRRIGAVVGLGLGPTLRGTGAVVGVYAPLPGTRFFTFGGARFPLSAEDRFRWVIGAGVRIVAARE